MDHRRTVSMAVNQGISFCLGCPKSALVSLPALITRAENVENCPKDIFSYGRETFRRRLESWQPIVLFFPVITVICKTQPPKKIKSVTPTFNDLQSCSLFASVFLLVNDGLTLKAVWDHQVCRDRSQESQR